MDRWTNCMEDMNTLCIYQIIKSIFATVIVEFNSSIALDDDTLRKEGTTTEWITPFFSFLKASKSAPNSNSSLTLFMPHTLALSDREGSTSNVDTYVNTGSMVPNSPVRIYKSSEEEEGMVSLYCSQPFFLLPPPYYGPPCFAPYRPSTGKETINMLSKSKR